jgi:hypothetical protein
MSVTPPPVIPSIRTTGLSGLVLFVLSLVACTPDGPPMAVFAPADLDTIEVASVSEGVTFGPIDLGEIEITAETIEEPAPSPDADAVVRAGSNPDEVAKAWLAQMETAPAPSPERAERVAPTEPESMGALGAGIGVVGSDYDPDFKPMRKSFASRAVETSGAVASIDAIGPTGGAKTASLEATRKPASRGPKPLEAEDIKSIVHRQRARVRACYERALKSESHLSGKLMMAWSVHPDGSVSDVEVADDQLGSDKVAGCVSHAVSTFRFPEGTEVVQVEYPMVFEPGNHM